MLYNLSPLGAMGLYEYVKKNKKLRNIRAYYSIFGNIK